MGIETLAIASLVGTAGSGIMGAAGAKQTASANAAAAQYQSQVAANNAIIAQRNAVASREAGASQAQTNDLKTGALIGKQLATQAANGLDVNSGTNLAVRESALNIGHLDTLTILNNAAKQAAGYQSQAMNFTAESQLDTAKAANAKTAGDFNVATSLLGSAGSFADKWAGYSQKGVF
jgi:hypothetical protein